MCVSYCAYSGFTMRIEHYKPILSFGRLISISTHLPHPKTLSI
uniref:Uncharacterized protein n=1 Tax=Rhizophora mucronata TaxID=61149 RepID=A0A2P2PBF2_RHIMU